MVGGEFVGCLLFNEMSSKLDLEEELANRPDTGLWLMVAIIGSCLPALGIVLIGLFLGDWKWLVVFQGGVPSSIGGVGDWILFVLVVSTVCAWIWWWMQVIREREFARDLLRRIEEERGE